MSERCPTCDSPSPLKHPAMQADGGEVQPCPNVWHFSGPLTEEQCDDDFASDPDIGHVSADTLALVEAATKSRPASMLQRVDFDIEDEDPSKLSRYVPFAAYERVVAERNKWQNAAFGLDEHLSELSVRWGNACDRAEAAEAEIARLRSDLNQAADLVTTLVRADNNRTGKGPGGRITGADTLPLQQLLGLALTLREPFGNLGPSSSEGNTSA